MKRIFFISAILTMAVLSFAEESGSDWNLYGSARVVGAQWNRGHWYQDDSLYTGDDTLEVKSIKFDMQFNSRFGASYKGEKLGFRFEAGWGYVLRDFNMEVTGGEVQSKSQRVRNALTLRRLYGEWFINEYFSMLVGHEWSIANFLNSGQIFDNDMGLVYCGALYTGRKPQIRFSYKHDLEPFNWKTEISVAKNDTFMVATQSDGTEENEEILPKFEGGVSVGFSTELFDANAQFIGGFTRYRQHNNRELEDDVISIIKTECYAFEVGLRFWKLKTVFDFAWGTNLAAYGVFMGDPEGYRMDPDMKIFYPFWGFKDDSAQANLVYSACSPFIKQGCVIVNFKPFPWIAAEWGGGMVITEPSAIDLLELAEGKKNAFKRMAWYANLQFSFVDDHVFIIPEYSFSDLGGGLAGQTTFGSGGKWKAYSLKVQIDI